MDPNDPLVPVVGPEGQVQTLTQPHTVVDSTDLLQQMRMTLRRPVPVQAPQGRYTRYCSREHSITQGQISLAWKGIQATAQHLGANHIYFPPDIINLHYDTLDLSRETISAAFDQQATHDRLFHIVCVRYRGYPKRYFAIGEHLRPRNGPEKQIFTADERDPADDTVKRLKAWYSRYMNTADRPPEADRHRRWLPTHYGNSESDTYATGHKVAYCFKVASELFHQVHGSLTIHHPAPLPDNEPRPNRDLILGASGSDTAHVNSFLALSDLY